MKGEWSLYAGRWSPEFCKSIIEKSNKYDFYDAHIGNASDGVQDSSSRRSRVKFVQKTDPDFKDVFTDLWMTAVETNNIFYNFHVTKLDFVQITEYDAVYQGEYKQHRDVFWLDNHSEYHRKLSCVVQLSDPSLYTGGDLVLDELELEKPDPHQIRHQGSIIYFPSFIKHAVTPVTSGKRYSLVAWFEGPKWR